MRVNASQFDIDPIQSYQYSRQYKGERISLQGEVVIILVIRPSEFHSFLKGTTLDIEPTHRGAGTYHALRRNLPGNVAPGFDSFPLGRSTVRENDENQTRRPLLESNLANFRI
jgi:hypothetical protein